MENKIDKEAYVTGQYRVASISYGLFFCLIGFVINIVEPIKACNYK